MRPWFPELGRLLSVGSADQAIDRFDSKGYSYTKIGNQYAFSKSDLIFERCEPLSDRNAEAIAELMLQIARHVEAEANASDLKPAQWAALRYLAKAATSARTNNAFARYHQTTTGTVTLTLKALFEKGLLKRETDPDDKRLVRFDVTPHGEAMLKRDPLGSLARSIQSLRAERRAYLADALTDLLIER